VEKIVRRVLEKVKTPALSHTTRYPIGLNEMIESFENKVPKKQQNGNAQVVGIVGMGGAGKTTLALELFNRKNSNYEKSYFLHDVRAGKSSLPSLQRKLLMGFTQLHVDVDNYYEGREMLREHLSSSDSKLIVLDNVDDRDQVDALLPNLKSVLSSNSFVLITCRDRHVLTRSGVEKSSIYYLNGLNPQYSLELFCLHAFRQPHPPPEFKDPVDKFLRVCDGLPLSLEVLGALLHGENDISLWDAHLDRLRKMLHPNIQETLQISYEALNTEDRKMFLDIACVFIGENKDMAIRIWDGSGWNGFLGFQNLQNRCLVQVDNENTIKMHEHLRDLGRAIAQASGSLRFLWPPTENIDELLQQTSVSSRSLSLLSSIQ
jgi:GTPase SAR1 family protein